MVRRELEQRVLSGLKDRLQAPEVVAEGMRAYAEEVNRLNRERRASGDTWRAELAKVERQIQGMVEAIKEGMFQRTMIAAMDALEARKEELALPRPPPPPRTCFQAHRNFTPRRSRI